MADAPKKDGPPWAMLGFAFVALILMPVAMRQCSSEISIVASQIQAHQGAIHVTIGLWGDLVVGLILVAVAGLIIRHYYMKE